jgi:uncharacterized protein YoxC
MFSLNPFHHLASRRQVEALKEIIMTTQTELATSITALTEQVAKIANESTATLAKVNELEAAIANSGGVSPEVDAAFAALKAQVQIVDDLVPDAPAVAGDSAAT